VIDQWMTVKFLASLLNKYSSGFVHPYNEERQLSSLAGKELLDAVSYYDQQETGLGLDYTGRSRTRSEFSHALS
jgi:hypothetical protein